MGANFLIVTALLAGFNGAAGPDTLKIIADTAAVRVETKDMTATADKVTYDFDSKRLQLDGSVKAHASLHSKRGELHARRIVMSLQTGDVRAEGIRFFDARH